MVYRKGLQQAYKNAVRFLRLPSKYNPQFKPFKLIQTHSPIPSQSSYYSEKILSISGLMKESNDQPMILPSKNNKAAPTFSNLPLDDDPTVEVYTFDGVRYLDVDELIGMLQVAGIIGMSRQNAKSDQSEEVFYNPDLFIEHAKMYFEMDPKNLEKSAEKLYLACVYVIKLYSLQMNIYPASHNSMNFLVDVARAQLPAEENLELFEAWTAAQHFHSSVYGVDCIKREDKFAKEMKMVEGFVKQFPLIDPEMVCNEFQSLLKCSKKRMSSPDSDWSVEVKLDEKKNFTYWGGKQHHYKLKLI